MCQEIACHYAAGEGEQLSYLALRQKMMMNELYIE
jgi:hypothetical protein